MTATTEDFVDLRMNQLMLEHSLLLSERSSVWFYRVCDESTVETVRESVAECILSFSLSLRNASVKGMLL